MYLRQRKVKSLALSLVLIVLLASCSKPENSSPITSISKLEGQAVAILNASMSSLPEEIARLEGFTPGKVLVFDTLNEALAALQSGRAKAILGVFKEEADFLIASNDTLHYLPRMTDSNTSSLSMLTHASDTQLAMDINAVIEELRTDKTLEKLVEDYITSIGENDLSDAPTAKDSEDNEDGEALRIGISGQWPPFDYMTPDGVATGFNVALSIAVAEKLGVSVEFVTVPMDQKFTALMSKRIDIYFFHPIIIPIGESFYATDIYYTDAEIGCIVLK
jgi:ABC-type amino acid transport substrate-binding protein